ncbi:DUF2285 domain-containing protein [Acidocella sp.]|uniref:DUF2285 domain-containing protein n=1 Tax=Acidocella sp. TaxID=50710 RepID=UPI00261E38A5|nr:DUF2285 domain-containing protein [Acidocella sp.]
MAELIAAVDDNPIWSDQVTLYDQQHFVTYARLLDADTANADWRDVARIVLLLDPAQDPDSAHRCWKTHLERARWMVTVGYEQLLENAELANQRNSAK